MISLGREQKISCQICQGQQGDSLVDGAGSRRRDASCRCGPPLPQNKSAIKGLDGKDRTSTTMSMVGVTNVGKSTLINANYQEITGDKDVIDLSL